ncbi:MAG TPA: TetR/AcrR family transcriptional regulator [Streptosporangiaceae bacterium]|nr:TetR/AcrR family transcriptional regulator [Streptosporangiaceae bacterium]
MASPRDPARSKENAPIADLGPVVDDAVVDVAVVDDAAVDDAVFDDVVFDDDMFVDRAFDGEPEVIAHSVVELADEQVEDDEPEVTPHLMEITEILPVELAVSELAEAPSVDLSDNLPVVKGLVAKRRTPRSVRPRRGRPRSAHADREILRAATEILEVKGVGGLSIEEVASKASVGKTTIYRRWSSRGTLALDAFLAVFDGQQALPDTGTFSGDLRIAFGRWVKAVAGTSAGIMLVGLIAELQQDRILAAKWQDQVVAPLRAQFSIMLDRAISRGEIPGDTDASVVLDLVFGACYYRLLHGHRPLNEQFVNQVVDVVTIGVGAKPELRAPGELASSGELAAVRPVLIPERLPTAGWYFSH